MKKNYLITNDDKQNIKQAEQTAQLYGSGIILSLETHTLYTEYTDSEIPIVVVISLVGYENQTYSDLNIESDLKNTGAICLLDSLPNFTYALSINGDTYNEKGHVFI